MDEKLKMAKAEIESQIKENPKNMPFAFIQGMQHALDIICAIEHLEEASNAIEKAST